MSEGPQALVGTIAQLVGAARELVGRGGRTLLGITGPPAAGKSTLAAAVVEAIGADAALVGLDGFHLANAELDRLQRRERKGAPDTFDAAGFRDLLRRIRSGADEIVYASAFDRAIEESIACAVPVSRDVPLVVVEGNYLLVDEAPWSDAAALLDECWYIDLPDGERMHRLVDRHMRFGRDRPAAEQRASGSDLVNARLIAGTRGRATRVVTVLPD